MVSQGVFRLVSVIGIAVLSVSILLGLPTDCAMAQQARNQRQWVIERVSSAGSVAVNDEYVYVLLHNSLYQFSAKDLKLLTRVPIEPPKVEKQPEEPGDGSNPAKYDLEFELGVFKVIQLRPDKTSLAISFTVMGVVEKNYQKEFQELFEKRKSRVKQKIGEVVRQAPEHEIYSSSLAKLKNKLLNEVNKVLDPNTQYVKQIVLIDFEPIEF